MGFLGRGASLSGRDRWSRPDQEHWPGLDLGKFLRDSLSFTSRFASNSLEERITSLWKGLQKMCMWLRNRLKHGQGTDELELLVPVRNWGKKVQQSRGAPA